MYVCSPIAAPRFLRELQGIIFDCDGVLVDSRDANRMYYNYIRERLGMLPITPEEEDYVHTHSVNECLARIIPTDRLEEANEVRRHIDYHEEILPFVYVEPGLARLLALLKRSGIRLAVSTNRTDTVERLLDYFDLRLYFDPVMSLAQVSSPKPNPEGVHKILSTWGLGREQVAYVGDSALDERTARAAGVSFWSYKNPGLLAAMYIPDFDSLAHCLHHVLPERGL